MMTPAPAAREGDRVTSNRASAPSGRMTEAEFRSLYERLRGQVPWGADDRRGALNHLGPAQIRAAASEVRLGRTVSLAAPCHVAFDGTLYNGVPASAVTAAGAVELSIAIAADGIAGRGVLLDIPRS